MTSFFEKIFTRYPIKTRRALELLPGFIAWTIILFPVWGSLFIPTTVAYFILFFDVYWVYKSFTLVINNYQASKRIKEAEKENWYEKSKRFDNIHKVQHVLVIPNYKESAAKIRTTLQAIARQSFPTKQIHIVIAMEEREPEAKERAKILIPEFKDTFGSIFATFHPDVEGEVKGKSSNEAFGGREAHKRLFVDGPYDINFATVSSVDADSIFDKEYFAYLAYEFLRDTKRYNKFWQSATVYHNNI